MYRAGRILAQVVAVVICALAAALSLLGLPDLGVGLFCVAFPLLVLLYLMAERGRESARTRRLRALAERLGFEFRRKSPVLAARLSAAGFLSFDLPDADCEVSNVLSGRRRALEFGAFDYGCSLEANPPRRQTVFYIRSPHLDLPQFRLEPEVLWSPTSLFMKTLWGLSALLFGVGRDEVRIRGSFRFLSRYVLCGEDQVRIRQLFSEEMQTFLERKLVHVEGRADTLILYRGERLVGPRRVTRLLAEGQRLYELMRASGGCAARRYQQC